MNRGTGIIVVALVVSIMSMVWLTIVAAENKQDAQQLAHDQYDLGVQEGYCMGVELARAEFLPDDCKALLDRHLKDETK